MAVSDSENRSARAHFEIDSKINVYGEIGKVSSLPAELARKARTEKLKSQPSSASLLAAVPGWWHTIVCLRFVRCDVLGARKNKLPKTRIRRKIGEITGRNVSFFLEVGFWVVNTGFYFGRTRSLSYPSTTVLHCGEVGAMGKAGRAC